MAIGDRSGGWRSSGAAPSIEEDRDPQRQTVIRSKFLKHLTHLNFQQLYRDIKDFTAILIIEPISDLPDCLDRIWLTELFAE